MTAMLQSGNEESHHRSLAMHASKVMRTAAAALLLATAPLLHAQTLAAHPKPPEIHQSSGVRYVSGGIGSEAVRQMQAISGQFNVRLSFQDPSEGGPVSGVMLILANEKGKRLLRLVTDGPLAYLKLPHGSYYLTVIYQGADHEQWITAEDEPMDLTFLFNLIDLEQYWLQAGTHSPQYPTPT
ncbi:hypothetical protein D8I24_2975 (plasmid) [Cupriavidus necator H850]|uniref:hypothetical protein n=1 Tax=Cupriavidus necator TaxID=106590 RepID=UPI001E2E1500|nr:hypothetical protein [Cupriavidus necator]KAI3603152.1 hypothetical protein D8I24_2975 [Cupriavidus necator H850]